MAAMRPSSSHRTEHHRGFLALDAALRVVTPLLTRWDLPPVLPLRAPAIFVGNHRSLFDIVVGVRCFAHFRASVRIMVAGRYFDLPIAGRLLRMMGAIPVNGSGLAALKEALAALEAGESVVIMPEGRIIGRSERGAGVGMHSSGLGLLAVRSGAPLAICGITGSEQVWPAGERLFHIPRFFKGRPTVRVQIHALPPPERGRLDRESITQDTMAALGALVVGE